MKNGKINTLSPHKIDLKKSDIYPTSIFGTKVQGYGIINKKLEKYIYSLRQKHPDQKLYSCVGGWNSPDWDFNDEIPKEFISILYPYILKTVSEELNWDITNHQIAIQNMWSIVNNKYAYNLMHTHGEFPMAMAYYVKVPEGINNGGEFFFKDPRTVAMNSTQPPMDPELKNPRKYEGFSYGLSLKSIPPEEGMLLLFPGWLEHGVHQSLVEEDRIVISANISMLKKQ